MQNCTTILGVIDMRQRGISYTDCRNVCRNKDKYLQPLLDRLRSTSKKNRQLPIEDTYELFLFKYVNFASLFIICTILALALLILLSAKTGSQYITYTAVQFNYHFFLMMNLFMISAILIKKNAKFLYGVAICALLLFSISTFVPVQYTTGFMTPYENDSYKIIADHIVNQYI